MPTSALQSAKLSKKEIPLFVELVPVFFSVTVFELIISPHCTDEYSNNTIAHPAFYDDIPIGPFAGTSCEESVAKFITDRT